MKLSVVIVAWGEHEWPLLQNNLDALVQHELGFEWEILIVYNNGDGDWILSRLADRYGSRYGDDSLIRVRIIGRNLGFVRGLNFSLDYISGEYLMILNPDIVIKDQQDIDMMVSHLDQHPKVGLVGPQLRNPDEERTIQYTCARRYGPLTPVYRRTPLGRFKFAQRSIDKHLMTDFDHHENRDVDWLMGSCLVTRTSLFRKLKGFDERLFIYFSDYEFADRVSREGFGVRYLAPSTIVHDHQRSSNYGSDLSGTFKTISSVSGRWHLKDWYTYTVNRLFKSYWHERA